MAFGRRRGSEFAAAAAFIWRAVGSGCSPCTALRVFSEDAIHIALAVAIGLVATD